MSDGLSLACYRVTVEAREALVLPEYLGSTLRGAFGHVFRMLCCPARPDEPCPLPEICPYHVVFETAPPLGADVLRGHEAIPRPFTIAPPPAGQRDYPAGAEVSFDLTLIGRAREFFPHFVVTLREVDRIGRGRRRIALRRIEAMDPLGETSETAYSDEDHLVRNIEHALALPDCAGIPCPGDGVRLRFLTQTRLKHGETFVRRPEFHVVFRRLLGRLSSLARFHGGGPLDVDFRDLIDQATAVRLVRDQTEWITWARYSRRQDRRMEWAGLVGTASYEGDLAPFWPYLVFGQWTHVGSGCTFGLGRYRVEGQSVTEARTEVIAPE